jgi:HlyD family secretion protein
MPKLVVKAPSDGVVLNRSVEPGETVTPGSVVMTIGQLNALTLTVYLPEDRYGQVNLGDSAQVTVDSFPGVDFSGTVNQIADQAEFTPRNVQTEEGRRTTVFAVQLQLSDTQNRLKPGMPADVLFELN